MTTPSQQPENSSQSCARSTTPAGSCGSSPAARILLCAVLATVVLAAVMRYSFQKGRLSIFPRFDDVSYMDDGLSRLQTLKKGGLSAAVREYVQTPPHSPYSDLLATAAFGLFGAHDWAPYAANWPLVFAIFLFADRILRGVGFPQRVLCLVFLASIPFVNMSVHEFRPDFAAALLTAAGIFWLVTGPRPAHPLRRRIGAGACFALALWVKPTFFPATLVFFFASWAARIWVDRFDSDERVPFGQIGREFMASLLPMLLIPVPHFLIVGRKVVDYIYENQFGPRHLIWVLHGGRLHHLAYFLTGEGGRFMLGIHLYLLLGALAACAVVALREKRPREVARAAIPLGFMLFLTWLLPTLNPHKQVDFALTFQILLVFALFRALSHFLSGHNRRCWTIALLAMVVVGITCFRWPPKSNSSPADRDDHVRIVNGVYQAIVMGSQSPHVAPSNPQAPVRVLLTSAGDLNIWLLDYMARKDSLPITFFSPSDTGDSRIYVRAFDEADFIVAADSYSMMYGRYILSAPVQDELVAALRKRADFALIAKFNLEKFSRSVYLFRRVPKSRIVE